MRPQPYTPYCISIDAELTDLADKEAFALHHVLPGLLTFKREALTTPVAQLDHPDTDTFGNGGYTPFDHI